jgi:hypothetical protein
MFTVAIPLQASKVSRLQFFFSLLQFFFEENLVIIDEAKSGLKLWNTAS